MKNTPKSQSAGRFTDRGRTKKIRPGLTNRASKSKEWE